MKQSVRPRRSVLYVPAANTRAMDKTSTLGCDAVIFDMEDAVAPTAKTHARDALRAHFSANPASHKERIIRVNAATTEWGDDDLALAIACRPDAVLLPKVEEAEQMRRARAALDEAGCASVRLWAMIETPRGIVDIGKIARLGADVTVGLDCLVVGTNDIARETGLPIPAGRATMKIWLATLVIHARAYGIDILDGVFNDFGDAEGFIAECNDGALLGFDGKTLIHPAQIEPANAAFSPSQAALAEACAIIEAFAAPENAGRGVLALGGKMVEILHLEMARAIIARSS